MSNRKAVETLGMPQGTASGRLRKMLLFRQLKKHDENICVRCSGVIETVEELSVEHIKPWEGISAELFWDLDNVAFSHMKCNVPHVRHGAPWRKIAAPEGQSWCFDCESFKVVEEFDKNAIRWNGLHSKCKFCKSKQNALRNRRVSA
jgi:hypothetical protein